MKIRGGVEKRAVGAAGTCEEEDDILFLSCAMKGTKYQHPWGGMKKFAEVKTKECIWRTSCLEYKNHKERRVARAKLSEELSDEYKEAFIAVNTCNGWGRPKANNISAAKKTVKMVCERLLLTIETEELDEKVELSLHEKLSINKELRWLKMIEIIAKDHPDVGYDELRALARAQVDDVDIFAELEQENKPEDMRRNDEVVTFWMKGLKDLRARAKQELGEAPNLSKEWLGFVLAAGTQLLNEGEERHYVPPCKLTENRRLGCAHYTRRNMIHMECCGTWSVCRICHGYGEPSGHAIDYGVNTFKCMLCKEVQPRAQNCRNCDAEFAEYYCETCGITDDTPGYELRHCDDCNVCVPGASKHCMVCEKCIDGKLYMQHLGDHYCSNQIMEGHATQVAEQALASGVVKPGINREILPRSSQDMANSALAQASKTLTVHAKQSRVTNQTALDQENGAVDRASNYLNQPLTSADLQMMRGVESAMQNDASQPQDLISPSHEEVLTSLAFTNHPYRRQLGMLHDFPPLDDKAAPNPNFSCFGDPIPDKWVSSQQFNMI